MPIYLPILAAFLVYWVLYAPQPLLPFFTELYALSESEAALLITAALLPLSLAPLSYGYLLQSVSSIKLLRVAILGLALSEMVFVLVDSFALLVAMRLVQGILLPATLTSIMTYLSANTQGAYLQRVMSIYVASTIIGGYSGRLLAGAFATYFSWQLFFYLIIGSLLLCFLALSWLPDEIAIRSTRPDATLFLKILPRHGYFVAYLGVSCLFFVFAAITTFLPYRITEILVQPSEFVIGLMYTSYLVGLFTSLGSSRLQMFFGSQANALIVGFMGYIIALLITLIPNIWLLFGAFAIACASMFLLHTVAASMLNQQAGEHKGIVNGLYLTFYYAGGTIGSYAPGILYQYVGWNAFIMLLIAVSMLGMTMIMRYKKASLINN